MKKIAIVIGHTPMSGGAQNPTSLEFEFGFNSKIAIALAAKVRVMGFQPVIIIRNTYTTLPTDVNNTDADVCVSLHCNAFDKKTEGCEVLCFTGSKSGNKLATIMLDKIEKVLGNPNRGIKEVAYDYQGSKGDRGGYLLQKTSMPAVIVEPFFIDNDAELKNAYDKFGDLVTAYAEGLLTFLK